MKTVMIFVYIQQPLCVLIERVRPSKIKNHLRVLQDCFQTAKNYPQKHLRPIVTEGLRKTKRCYKSFGALSCHARFSKSTRILAVEARTTGDGDFLLARSIFLLSENNMYFGHFDSESI